jgi:hypothetical protein
VEDDSMLTRDIAGLTLILSLAAANFSSAQTEERPLAVAEMQTGWVGFVDESATDHAAFGGATRFYVSPRVAFGPEVAYLRGPGSDRDVMITGNLSFDVLRPRFGRPPRVSPFVLVGGGFEQHVDRFGSISYSSYEGAFTGGGGVRVWFNDHVYGVVETRFGWEPHLRATGGIGVTLR